MKAINTNNNIQHNEDEYCNFLKDITDNIKYSDTKFRIFKTKINIDLFELFLDNLPKEIRQHYNCNTCRKFVNKYGGLIFITDDGNSIPLIWPIKVQELYQKSVDACYKVVMKSKIDTVFLSNNEILGNPMTGIWKHMHYNIPNQYIVNNKLKNVNELIAEKKEDYKTLFNGIKKYNLEIIKKAYNLFLTESLNKSNKFINNIAWLIDVYNIKNNIKNNKIKNNLLWLNIANAPKGFCNINSGVLSILFDDIKNNINFDIMRMHFNDKTGELYQRPQELPTKENKEKAEIIVKRLEIADSLSRRFASINEIKKIWEPSIINETNDNTDIFKNIKTKNQIIYNDIEIQSTNITWNKFKNRILPNVDKIEFITNRYKDHYVGFTSETNKNSKPILKWDLQDNRNPISIYLYNGGSMPSRWGLERNSYINVIGISYAPYMWKYDHCFGNDKMVIFLLKGAKDSKNECLGLFPSILIQELYEIRSTIEAFSNSNKLLDIDGICACGIAFTDKNTIDIRVTINNEKINYRLERWD